jgi:hypothetical protein|tara:strand:+ start:507 stop:701 length:195 start_codon:yes stop_codon:yes gene_type:complete
MPFKDYSEKQKQLAGIAEPKKVLDGKDFAALRKGKAKMKHGGEPNSVMCKGQGRVSKKKVTKLT